VSLCVFSCIEAEEENGIVCPDIDRLIKTVTEIVAGMNFCKEEDTKDTLSLMSDWKAELESLGMVNGLNLKH
jgi:hypothetical protein